MELVRVITSDGMRLDGSLRMTDAPQPSALCDVAILVHGTGSNFYSSTLFDSLEARLLNTGLAVLRINTRGHDGISTAIASTGGRRQGAAYELVDDCRADLAAWVRFATDRGFLRVLVAGHSLGAVKLIYAHAHQALVGVDRLVAISPPRLSYSHFLADRSRPEFEATYEQANAKLSAGRGDDLMEITFPLPYLVTARGYLDKYGPEERYNFLRHLPKVQSPLLVTFGSLEVQGNSAFRGLPDEVEHLARRHQLPCDVAVVAGADHFYSAMREELGARISRWLKCQHER